MVVAGIITVVFLFCFLVTGCGVRYVCKKLRDRNRGYQGVLQRDESSDPTAVKTVAGSHMISDELKTSESQFSVTPAEELDDVTSQSQLINYAGSALPNHTSKGANGSIITMTLQNNHLIVETEERGDAVEAAESSQQASSEDVMLKVAERFPDNVDYECPEVELQNQAQIHEPPEEFQHADDDDNVVVDDDDLEPVEEEDSEEDDANEDQGAGNTGLSQSDLSVSSAGSNNPSYRYGNQVGYMSGQFGYADYSGYSCEEGCHTNEVVSAVRKPEASPRENREGGRGEGEAGGSESAGRSTTEPDRRVSTNLPSTKNNPHPQPRVDSVVNGDTTTSGSKSGTSGIGSSSSPSDDSHNVFNGSSGESGNGFVPSHCRTTSLPPRLAGDPGVTNNNYSSSSNNNGDDNGNNNVNSTTVEQPQAQTLPDKAAKRASLPLIPPELCTQLKQSTKSILEKKPPPTKFEKLCNEASPLEEHPMDTADSAESEEHENKAFVSADQTDE